MFSKPLFKQSIKANFTRWIIVTLASCFIVAVVILILGNLNVNKIRGSLEDLFKDSEKQVDIQKESVENYNKVYDVYSESLEKYKEYEDIVERAIAGKANKSEYEDFTDEFKDAIKKIRNGESTLASSKSQLSSGQKELESSKSTFESSKASATDTEVDLKVKKQQLESGIGQYESGISKSEKELEDLKTNLQKVNAGIAQYKEGILKSETEMSKLKSTLETVNAGINQINASYDLVDDETKLALDAQLNELNENKSNLEAGITQYEEGITKAKSEMADLQEKKAALESGISQYESGITKSKNELSELKSNLDKVNNGLNTIDTQLNEASSQIQEAEKQISDSSSQIKSAENKLASSKQELKTKTLDALKDKIADGVYDEAIKENDEETSQKSKNMAIEVIDAYRNGDIVKEDDIKTLAKNYVADSVYDEAIKDNTESDSEFAKSIAASAIDEYNNKLDSGKSEEEAIEAISESLIEKLPEDVQDAIEEIKDLDVYGLVVGNILFRIAGLLLPMIFVIMTANDLLAGQVDSGSMAYILSTPTRRSKVTITQMLYLMMSVLVMYVCICTTSIVCMEIIKDSEITITKEEMVKFNMGSFFVMFAVSGICYLSSSIFNREKNSISVGGGLTMFFLVCSILGLFGEEVIPSAIRIDAMNYFNYASIITLFNVNSMLNGTNEYMKGLTILFAIGMIAYIIGIMKFDRKDLPL